MVAVALLCGLVIGVAEAVLAAQLTLSWDDNSPSEVGFVIDRRFSNAETFTELATVGADATSYVDANVPPGLTLCYRVRAYNSAGTSAPSNEACATASSLTVSFESPENGQAVSGIGAIRGWAFDSRSGAVVRRVELMVDGTVVGEIPCCSSRADVRAGFPQAPAQNTENSGWGTEVNWSELTPGTRVVQARVTDADGESVLTDAHTVTVVRPGSTSFVEVFTLSNATVEIDNQDLVLKRVRVREKNTQEEHEITARFRWVPSSQSIVLVQSEITDQFAALGTRVFSQFASFAQRVWPWEWFHVPSAHAAANILAMLESPEGGQPVFGIGVIRGWAFVDDGTASISTIRLVADGQQVTTIACCSAREDVAAIFSQSPDAQTSGWGITVNYAALSAGPHTIEIQIESTAGTTTSTAHQVTVVKREGFEFIDQFDLSEASARIEGEEVVISGVRIRDKASEQTAMVELRLRWLFNSQTLGIVAIN